MILNHRMEEYGSLAEEPAMIGRGSCHRRLQTSPIEHRVRLVAVENVFMEGEYLIDRQKAPSHVLARRLKRGPNFLRLAFAAATNFGSRTDFPLRRFGLSSTVFSTLRCVGLGGEARADFKDVTFLGESLSQVRATVKEFQNKLACANPAKAHV